ncbi:MAG: peptidylprolyl isomerase [Bacteroidota bacterium]|nr:peptidylprolyl isomerase [Bacteroidota bacterium]MDP4192158.1 peptidylprolyl isomerase [Bacteroidota bacterium]MDP4195787.1 peptidylprolyl isomerase [Bacteroidota bacterium]
MKRFLAIAYIVFSGSVLLAQTDNQIIAKAGNLDIQASEFKERFELTPWPRGANYKTTKNPQLDFLYTLVAEKLLAQEAQSKGFDTTRSFQNAFKTIEKMYVRDALYKNEITKRINISASDLNNGCEKSRYQLKLDFISAETESEIQKISKSLKSGKSFDALREAKNGEKDSCITISYGDLSEQLENTLYKLKTGQYTNPFMAFGKWYIFRLVEKTDYLAQNPTDRDQLVSNARQVITKRLNEKYYQEYYHKFFTGKKVETEANLFRSLSDKVIHIINERKSDPKISAKDKCLLILSDFIKIEEEFGPDSLNLTFIRFGQDPVSLRQFINEIAYDGFSGANANSDEIRIRFDNRIRTYIENELLSREGYRQGLQNLPEVKRIMKMWKEDYLSQLFKGQIMDSVKSGKFDDKRFSSNSDSSNLKFVNIVEIVTDNLDNVEKIFTELKNNIDIKQLARTYSKREDVQKTGGETGYFSIDSRGEIGRIAAKMQIGEVYGPLKTTEGYSVFKLIDRKDSVENKIKSVNTGNSGYDPATKKYLNILTDYTAKLAKSYGVTINEDLLNTVEAPNLNVFAYRYLGFGGRIMAVPFTVPFMDWVEQWKKSEGIIP